MTKELHCGDLMPGCQVTIEGRDADEVLTKAAVHAREHHGVATVPPAVVEKAKTLIRDRA